jgi:hypothetical protein
MVGEVLEPRLHSPIIFAGDEQEAVGGADLARELRHRGRRFAFRIFLVHAVEHREVDRLGVDQFGAVAARRDRFDDPAGELDPLPVAAIAAVEDEDVAAHANLGAEARNERVRKRAARMW